MNRLAVRRDRQNCVLGQEDLRRVVHPAMKDLDLPAFGKRLLASHASVTELLVTLLTLNAIGESTVTLLRIRLWPIVMTLVLMLVTSIS